MNRDRLMRTRLAGVLCSPIPERRNENATTKRVKLVTDEETRRDRQHRQEQEELDNPARDGGPALGKELLQIQRLGARGGGRQEDDGDRQRASHCSTIA